MIPEGRDLIGLALLAFGILRFYVAYRRYRNKKARIYAIKEAIKKHNPINPATKVVMNEKT
jgi:hypothetical protein